MIPINLYLSGFLSYRDPVEVDFTQFDLACIAGANGAGKSSLLDAMTWALFGVARKRDDSLVNALSSTAQVILTFAYEGNIYRVMRSKTRDKAAVLEFNILQHNSPGLVRAEQDIAQKDVSSQKWKPLTERSLRETELLIKDTLKLDYATFVNASFFLQGKADQFTQQSPSDRKVILSSILGLDVWEEYRKSALERRRGVEAEISSLDGRLKEIMVELNEEAERTQRLRELKERLAHLTTQRTEQQNALVTLQKLETVLKEQQRLVDLHRRQVEAAKARCQDLEKRLATRKQERNTYSSLIQRSAEIRQDYKNWKDLQKQVADLDQIASEVHQQEKQRDEPRLEIQSERARLQQEQRSLEKRRGQSQIDEGEIGKLDEELKAIELKIAKEEEMLGNREQIQEKHNSIRDELSRLFAAKDQLKKEMNVIKTRLEKIKSVSDAECPTCGQKIDKAEQNRMVEELTSQGTELGDQFRENQAHVQELTQQGNELEKTLGTLKNTEADLRRLSQEAARYITRLESLRSLQQEWETTSKPRLAEVERILVQEDYAHQARERLASIEDQLRQMGYDPVLHEALRKQVKDQEPLEMEYQKLGNAQAVLGQLEREIKDLLNNLQQESSTFETLNQEYQQSQQALAALQEQAPDLERAENLLRNLQEQENRVRLEVGSAQQRVDVLDDLRERRQEYEAKREEYAGLVGQYKQLERAFGKNGVPALLIEQALPEIENKANEILARLSDGSMSVRFITQAAYKDKKRDDLRETLDIQISDGIGQRDYELFSGGEAFRVNFAVRLALSEILAKRSGARLQTLVIDEGFGSQDLLGRQRLVEAINLVKEDFAKILVITHIDELKDYFPNRIEVEKTSRGSTIQVF